MWEFIFRVVFSWLAGLCPSGVRYIWVVTEHQFLLRLNTMIRCAHIREKKTIEMELEIYNYHGEFELGADSKWKIFSIQSQKCFFVAKLKPLKTQVVEQKGAPLVKSNISAKAQKLKWPVTLWRPSWWFGWFVLYLYDLDPTPMLHASTNAIERARRPLCLICGSPSDQAGLFNVIKNSNSTIKC